MLWENGCLMLFPADLIQLEKDVREGIGLKEILKKQFDLLSITINDIYEIQAFANNLAPYEKLILSITGLINDFNY